MAKSFNNSYSVFRLYILYLSVAFFLSFRYETLMCGECRAVSTVDGGFDIAPYCCYYQYIRKPCPEICPLLDLLVVAMVSTIPWNFRCVCTSLD